MFFEREVEVNEVSTSFGPPPITTRTAAPSLCLSGHCILLSQSPLFLSFFVRASRISQNRHGAQSQSSWAITLALGGSKKYSTGADKRARALSFIQYESE